MAADGGVAERAQSDAALVRPIAVGHVGREMQGVALAQSLLAALGAEPERSVEADHDLLGAWPVRLADVASARVETDLEQLEPAIAPVHVDQAAVDARLERIPVAVAAANEMVAD